jgi:hypothetical protein
MGAAVVRTITAASVGAESGVEAGAQEAVNSTATNPRAWKRKRDFIKSPYTPIVIP